jgi:Zn-dependent protease
MNAMQVLDILEIAISAILAIVFHEVAHGLAARMLGDTTASEGGRLSLNPLRHVDPVGTVVLPVMLGLAKLPVFGWAKPVPVNKWRLRNPRVGMMIVAAAGPMANIVLAVVSVVALNLLLRLTQYDDGPLWFMVIVGTLGNFIVFNLFLAVFNLLPIPPFDGSHLVEGLLPERAAAAYARLRPFGFPLMLVLLVLVPRLFHGFDPVRAAVTAVYDPLMDLMLDLGGWVYHA